MKGKRFVSQPGAEHQVDNLDEEQVCFSAKQLIHINRLTDKVMQVGKNLMKMK